jgi:hypothetical protein
MCCLSYLIRNQIGEFILRQGCGGTERQCKPEASGESDNATLHGNLLVGGQGDGLKPKFGFSS